MNHPSNPHSLPGAPESCHLHIIFIIISLRHKSHPGTALATSGVRQKVLYQIQLPVRSVDPMVPSIGLSVISMGFASKQPYRSWMLHIIGSTPVASIIVGDCHVDVRYHTMHLWPSTDINRIITPATKAVS